MSFGRLPVNSLGPLFGRNPTVGLCVSLSQSEVYVSGEQKLDRSVLEGKKADELKAIANSVGVPLSGRPTKSGVIDQILSFTGADAGRGSAKTSTSNVKSDQKENQQESP